MIVAFDPTPTSLQHNDLVDSLRATCATSATDDAGILQLNNCLALCANLLATLRINAKKWVGCTAEVKASFFGRVRWPDYADDSLKDLTKVVIDGHAEQIGTPRLCEFM
jgi:hypothetical protein